MKHLERSYSTLCCPVSDICSFVTPSSCVLMHLWQCNPLCLRWSLWAAKSYRCNKSVIEATGGELFNFMLFSFVLLLPPYPAPPTPTPTPLRLRDFTAMHSITLAMGYVDRKKLAIAITVLIEATGGKLFNFILSVSDIQSFFTTHPCVYMHL